MGSSSTKLATSISFISKLLYVVAPQRFSARASQLIKCQGFPLGRPKIVGNTIDKGAERWSREKLLGSRVNEFDPDRITPQKTGFFSGPDLEGRVCAYKSRDM